MIMKGMTTGEKVNMKTRSLFETDWTIVDG